jgi:HSP20 family protein
MGELEPLPASLAGPSQPPLTIQDSIPTFLEAANWSSTGKTSMASQDWEILILQRANALLQQAERIQRNFLQVAVRSHYRVSPGRSSYWEPPINVVETDDAVWVIAAIPGVKPDRIEVRLDAGELTISGERPLPACCTEGELSTWEIPLGRFERRLAPVDRRFPLSVAKTSLQDGLLFIELRKH